MRVGTFLPSDTFARPVPERRRLLEDIEAEGINHVAVGDHVSFHVGTGFDGLLYAASLLNLHPTLPVHVGVYLLALRHPVVVARQLADLALMAPGRLVLGVGVGGEDRDEFTVCGVDPATRGARTDESLAIVRALLTGATVDHDGAHFQLTGARIQPPADPPIPVVVGGRSDAAIARAARSGEGWLAIWVSPGRFADATAQVERQAVAAGRVDVAWQHGLQVWCGIGDTPAEGAEALTPYVAAGCRTFNLTPRGPDAATTVAAVAEVGRLLRAVGSPAGPTR